MIPLNTLPRLGAWALCLPISALAALSFDEATRIALQQAPALVAQQQALAGAQVSQPAASALPDPRLTLGVDNLPLSGADRLSLTRDFMTMQRIGLMQDVPNAAKRLARGEGAQARIERERALLAVTELAVRREAALAWLGVHFAERRAAGLAELEHENRLLLATLDARIANGKAMPADRAMARQEALALADRRDDAQRDITKARATLRRWVGMRADEALADEPALPAVPIERIRADLPRHAEIAAASASQAVAQAEVREADAEQRGDWGWEVAYSRRPQFGDMVSFQLSFDLPWNRERRQQPMLAAKQKDLARLDAERDDLLRRHAEDIDAQAAELAALDRQRERLAAQGLPLAAERVALTLASYEAGRSDLAAVLAARREAAETRLRLIDLDAQRLALRVRLSTWTAE